MQRRGGKGGGQKSCTECVLLQRPIKERPKIRPRKQCVYQNRAVGWDGGRRLATRARTCGQRVAAGVRVCAVLRQQGEAASKTTVTYVHGHTAHKRTLTQHPTEQHTGSVTSTTGYNFATMSPTDPCLVYASLCCVCAVRCVVGCGKRGQKIILARRQGLEPGPSGRRSLLRMI